MKLVFSCTNENLNLTSNKILVLFYIDYHLFT